MKPKYAIGLMSGTSLDGVDAVLTKIQGSGIDTELEVLAFTTHEIKDDLKQRILDACHPSTSSVDLITSLNVELGQLFSDAVTQVIEESGFKEPIDFVASHGQTIYHLPRVDSPLVRSTLQIGDPSQIAFDHHTQVVFNFRMMDMVAGGDGAPLVPYSEYILYREKEISTLLQNIGGIGNVTVIPANASLDDVTAFDTGPGNMMINAAVNHFYQEPYDKDGAYAAQGDIIKPLYDELINHPYLQLLPPKSTGRELFGEDVVLKICQAYPQQANDVIATLTQFTAFTIADAYLRYIQPSMRIDRVILGGGGAYNPVLVEAIRDQLEGIDVLTQEDLNLSSDAKEAIAFVIMGNETLHGKPSNVPSATGAKQSVILGQICPNPHGNN